MRNGVHLGPRSAVEESAAGRAFTRRQVGHTPERVPADEPAKCTAGVYSVRTSPGETVR